MGVAAIDFLNAPFCQTAKHIGRAVHDLPDSMTWNHTDPRRDEGLRLGVVGLTRHKGPKADNLSRISEPQKCRFAIAVTTANSNQPFGNAIDARVLFALSKQNLAGGKWHAVKAPIEYGQGGSVDGLPNALIAESAVSTGMVKLAVIAHEQTFSTVSYTMAYPVAPHSGPATLRIRPVQCSRS